MGMVGAIELGVLDIVLFVLGLAAAAFIAGLFVNYIRENYPGETIENWTGAGVNRDLSYLEAALLLGKHPGVLTALLLIDLTMRKKARILGLHPETVEWRGEEPEGPYETALFKALDSDGRFTGDGIYAFIDTLYEPVNQKMEPFSGRKTTLFYKKKVSTLWKESLSGGLGDERDALWLLLGNIEDYSHSLGDSPRGQMVRMLFRLTGFFRQFLFSVTDLSDKARTAKSGYFKHRKDLYRETAAAALTFDIKQDDALAETARGMADILGFSSLFKADKKEGQESIATDKPEGRPPSE
jgi:hypothetical protein